jgi:polyvinyl alcohol dehydrogenase (cytochrome)
MHAIKLSFVMMLTAIILLAYRRAEITKIKERWPHKSFVHGDGPYLFDDTLHARGKKIFYSSCYACHKDTIGSLAPGYSVMKSMTARAILASMDNGKMRGQAASLSAKERQAVAEWITNSELKTTVLPKDAYTSFSINENAKSVFDYSGWGGNIEATGFLGTEQAGISLSNINSLQLKWAFAFPDATIMRSKPAVFGEWLIVGGQYGDVFAINRKTGKAGWHFVASSAVRGAIVVQKQGSSITAFFADFSTNVYAINVKTGKQLWNNRAGIDAQSAITGSVAVYGGKVFVPVSSIEVGTAANGDYNCCFSSGALVALDARTGKRIWQHRVIVETAKAQAKKKNGKSFYGPSGAPVWCSPTIDKKRGLVYIGTGENYTYPTTATSDAIQAVDMRTGKLVWNFQGTSGDAYNVACPVFINCPEKPGPDFDFGMAPILVKRKDGKDILLAGQKSGIVYALTPESGNLVWKTRIGKGGKLGGIHWGMAADGENLYASNADNVIAIDKSDSSIKPSPGMYALDLLTGKVIWQTPTPGCTDSKDCLPFNSAAPAVIPGIVFAGSLDGHIRGYSTEDGKILWDFNTAKSYDMINGVTAKGGAIDGPAPVIADGMLFVNSGYGMFGQMPGNVLLAFGVDKK